MDTAKQTMSVMVEHRPAVYIETHGCKLNQADSEALARRFTQAGYRMVDEPARADVLVVNTCTVTHVADGKARHALRAAHRANPGAVLVATGCYAQRAPERLAQVQGVSVVLGNTQKDILVDHVNSLLGLPAGAGYAGIALAEDASASGPLKKESAEGRSPFDRGLGVSPRFNHHPLPGQEGGRGMVVPTSRDSAQPASGQTRAMVKIQEGCNQVCAYCIVPKVRGRERSVHPDGVVAQVQRLAAEGYQEVVLTGTQLGTYGFDIPGTSLADLIRRLLLEADVPRLRVSSLQPQELSDELLELWENPRLCPHFHLPLQSGSTAVLKAMRRRYSPGQYVHAVEAIRQRVPRAAITTDVMVGFPGETAHDFQETHDLCQDVQLSALHVFPYSPRPGTSATHLNQMVADAEKRRRMEALLALAGELARRYRQTLLGTTRAVLWETSHTAAGGQVWSGLTDNYVRVAAPFAGPLHNRITPVALERQEGAVVWGRVMQPFRNGAGYQRCAPEQGPAQCAPPG